MKKHLLLRKGPAGIDVIGLTGTHAAGKGTTVKYFERLGFGHFEAREFLWKEVDRRELPRNRPNLHLVANSLRAEFGAEHVAFSLYDQARRSGQNAVIESIYTVAEIAKIREAAAADGINFTLIALDADPRKRYDRAKEQRQSETDMIPFDKFIAEEECEMHSDDPHKHNLSACRGLADIRLRNDGTPEELYAQLDRHFGCRLTGIPG